MLSNNRVISKCYFYLFKLPFQQYLFEIQHKASCYEQVFFIHSTFYNTDYFKASLEWQENKLSIILPNMKCSQVSKLKGDSGKERKLHRWQKWRRCCPREFERSGELRRLHPNWYCPVLGAGVFSAERARAEVALCACLHKRDQGCCVRKLCDTSLVFIFLHIGK